MTLGERPFENIVGKGKNAGYQHYLLFPQCFLPYLREKSLLQQHLFYRLQMLSFINPLPDGKTLDLFKLKEFAADKINVYQKWKFGLERVENIVRKKGENASFQHFLLFQNMLQKATFSRSLNVVTAW